jgi:replicative DNA helicase
MSKNTQGSGMRVPPNSLDSERAVLGAVMIRPSALNEIEDVISADAFYADKHKIIFQAMQDLVAKHEPIDVLSLSHKLKEKKQLESIGGNAYLAELTQNVPASTNAKYYAEIVNKKYILRSLIDTSQHISELAFNEGVQEVDDILDEAEKKIFAITSTPKGQKFISMKETLATAWERIERLHSNKGELRGVPTGFKSLDNVLAGFQKSDLIILAARPSVGKTSLALDIARNTAIRHNTPVGIFSLEMDSQQLVDRMLAAEAQVNAWQLRTGSLPSHGNEFSKLSTAIDTLSKAPIYINDESSSSITKMRAFARRLKAEHGLGLIIVDYLQLMTTAKSYDNMVNQVTEISRSLKGLARDLDVPVLALSQLSRAVEARGGKPRLSDLRDSGSIEQDADVVMFIHREIDTEKGGKMNMAEIMIEKHRNGPTGKVDLYFDDKYTTFVDPEPGHGYDKMAEGANTGGQSAFGAF